VFHLNLEAAIYCVSAKLRMRIGIKHIGHFEMNYFKDNKN